MAVMRSPVLRPACATGPFSTTRPITVGATGRPRIMNTSQKITTASTKFIAGPANTMRKRTASGFRLKARFGSSVPVFPPSSGFSSSPIILTYPPSGTRDRQYSVSFPR